MKIAFHGAARTVTGSKHLVSLVNGKNTCSTAACSRAWGKRQIY